MMISRVVFVLILLLALALVTSARVVVISNNVTSSYGSVEANFSPKINGSIGPGVLYVAQPLNACSDLKNEIGEVTNGSSPFVLIIRGRCNYQKKLRNAQKAGFKAAIVYDDHFDYLHGMGGNAVDIIIHSVFVTQDSGKRLKKYTDLADVEVWITEIVETFETTWLFMTLMLIVVIAMFIVMPSVCFCHSVVDSQVRFLRLREYYASRGQGFVKALPSLIFIAVTEDNCTSTSCAICLEDYNVGDKLRILPCQHKFHAICVDSWLTTRRTFCPICKRDARKTSSAEDRPASENTPLLSSSNSSMR